ncbi:MAG: hypothetical protein EBR82_88190, partial [Caulobacteraceae bacterium]|nr:hypothetical protein [Caulobacteraceae bacterium]
MLFLTMNKVHWIKYEKRMFSQPNFLKARKALGNDCIAAYFAIVDVILDSQDYTASLESCLNESWNARIDESVVHRLITEFDVFFYDKNEQTVSCYKVDQSVEEFERKSKINSNNAKKRHESKTDLNNATAQRSHSDGTATAQRSHSDG